ncbi:tyrosine-protein phosphatase [Paraherbaspirillum soli]|uniref:Tyrosine-protein phosphatase n=1 Tax=Paraherbaspirillum soli TaxID=631222 RepID=A0ABW0M765_9BURK
MFTNPVHIVQHCGTPMLKSFNTETRFDHASAANGYIPFERIQNTRDLGGHLAHDGRRIRAGRLLRGGNPGLASAADIATLKSFKLDVVLDFRAPGEKQPAEQAFAEIFHWIADPVLVGNLSQETVLPMLKNGSAETSRQFMIDFYRDFPRRYQAQFKRFLTLAEQNKTMLYHCTAGKDRTGFASVLLLSALGVDHAAIIANYLESNHYNAAGNAQVLAQIAEAALPSEVVAPLLMVDAAYIEASLQVVEDDYDGMDHYLRQVLGIDLERIRRNYLEPTS